MFLFGLFSFIFLCFCFSVSKFSDFLNSESGWRGCNLYTPLHLLDPPIVASSKIYDQLLHRAAVEYEGIQRCWSMHIIGDLNFEYYVITFWLQKLKILALGKHGVICICFGPSVWALKRGVSYKCMQASALVHILME